MKLSIAAAVLLGVCQTQPQTALAFQTPLNKNGAPSRAFLDRILDGQLTDVHVPTPNNVGRRRIRSWHKLHLEPWSALRMSAAVDEPTSTVSVKGISVNGFETSSATLNGDAIGESILNGGGSGDGEGSKSSLPTVLSEADVRASVANYVSKYIGKTTSHIIYSKLQEYGTTVVNGYSGGAILPLLDQFHPENPRHAESDIEPIRWITNSNEASAGYVACGISKSSTSPVDGKLEAGVVVATSGPGVTNLITPMQDAICDGVPLVVMCGQAATNAPPEAFQSAPAVDLTRPCTKWSYQIRNAAEIPFVMDYAFYISRQGRPGPVFLDLPKNIQNQLLNEEGVQSFVDELEIMNGTEEVDDEKAVRLMGVNGSGVQLHLGAVGKSLPFEVNDGKIEGATDVTKDSDIYRKDHHQTDMIYTGGLNGSGGQDEQRIGGMESSSPLFAELVDLIAQAEKPVIIAGQGCNDSPEELKQFAEAYQIPVATTLHALGCFDERHPLALNMLGMHGHPTPNFLVQTSDLIICVGSRFDDRITGRMSDFVPEAREAAAEGRGGIIHVDIRLTELNRQIDPTYFVHSTGKKFLQRMNEEYALRSAAIDPEDAEQVQAMKPKTEDWLQKKLELQREFPVTIPIFPTVKIGSDEDHISKTPMSAQMVISNMNKQLLDSNKMDETIFTTGVGIHQMVAAQLVTWTQPRQMLSSGSLGTMGVSLGYSIGAQLANEKSIVISIDGDGSFNMSFTELKSVMEQKIPVKILLLDNESQMMVEYWQRLFFDGRFLAVDNTNPEYTKIADAFGIKSIYCDCTEDLEEKMNDFLFNDPGEPVLFHVKIERTPCLPLVAPGQALEEMILVDEDFEVDKDATPS
mmetsp:Transcript_28837/g.42702  ORF Transcript_28837/g.42702 Transcript_28837/m.42702 type:complete len:861 (-) Transcript_28837:348-2930(-)|eukprot:CAMPEP_0195530986 /NCGR_PEP_ID=MMETSP0794_2-20130614/34099_1 /TAXON_ID=515487 /ORGANISM="Stephanopyxis turris, Strain CCMP 815" /LENGTH=860 /DNA_ID=CAMNT_0040662615 /DNA_START=122 /DNA_END=2704 /DNA_ORIENTATION=+